MIGMRRSARVLGWAVLAAVSGAACAGDTAIVVDVTWSTELGATFAPDDQLRIFVGHPTGDPTAFDRADEAFYEESITAFDGEARYALTPTGGLDQIGDLQIVATVSGPGGRRGFGKAPSLVRFAAGEVRTVPISLSTQRFVIGGDANRCVAWGADTSMPATIGDPGNRDCDSFPDGVDCAPLVASDPGDPEICDGVDQACDQRRLVALPCNAASIGFGLGVRHCDEGGARDWQSCMPDPELPEALDLAARARIMALDDPMRDCAHAKDPLHCAGGAVGQTDIECKTDADFNLGCGEQLSIRDSVGPLAQSCHVWVVGGPAHAEWEVGFVEDNTDPLAETLGSIGSCDAWFRIIARTPKTVPRTVMILWQIDALPVRAAFVRLIPGDDGVCAAPSCDRLVLP